MPRVVRVCAGRARLGAPGSRCSRRAEGHSRGVPTFPRCRPRSGASRRGRQAGLGGPQPARHAAEQRVPEAGDVGHGGELAGPDDEHVEIGQRGHRGIAWAGVHGGQLAEEVAGSQGVDPPALLGHRHRAGEDQEELPADPPFAGQHLTRAHLDPLGQLGHVLQLRLGAVPQQVNGFQPLDGRLCPHGGYHDLASSPACGPRLPRALQCAPDRLHRYCRAVAEEGPCGPSFSADSDRL